MIPRQFSSGTSSHSCHHHWQKTKRANPELHQPRNHRGL